MILKDRSDGIGRLGICGMDVVVFMLIVPRSDLELLRNSKFIGL